jgi:hypothetical protein
LYECLQGSGGDCEQLCELTDDLLDELLVGHRRGSIVPVAARRGADYHLRRGRCRWPLGRHERAACDEASFAARYEETTATKPGDGIVRPGEGNQRNARVGDRAKLCGSTWSDIDEEPGGDVARRRHQNRVSNDTAAGGVELVAVPAESETRDGSTWVELHPAALEVDQELFDDATESPTHSNKQRPRACDPACRLGTRPSRKHAKSTCHAFLTDKRAGNIRGDDGERELVHATGVDTA